MKPHPSGLIDLFDQLGLGPYIMPELAVGLEPGKCCPNADPTQAQNNAFGHADGERGQGHQGGDEPDPR